MDYRVIIAALAIASCDPYPDPAGPCLAPHPTAVQLDGAPCDDHEDCARWSPCLDTRCDLSFPQGKSHGSCVVAAQVEAVYCGTLGGDNYVCSPQGECCAQVPFPPPVVP